MEAGRSARRAKIKIKREKPIGEHLGEIQGAFFMRSIDEAL